MKNKKQNMKKNKQNNKYGFTLVELLAVIVILAIILVIAVPKVMSVIEDAKKATLESTAKMIAGSAEKVKVQNTVLGKDEEITCDGVAKINKLDYETCEVVFEDNTAKVSIKGSGKFAGLYVCSGTKMDAKASENDCELVCSRSETIEKVVNVIKPYTIKNSTSCITYFTNYSKATGQSEESLVLYETLCTEGEVNGMTFNDIVAAGIQQGAISEKTLVKDNVIEGSITTEIVCLPDYTDGDTYIIKLLDEEEILQNGLVQTNATYTNEDDEEITVDAGIRYVGAMADVKNQVYFNCEPTDGTNAYGSENYDYASSCEVWRIIGVFEVEDDKGKSAQRIKIINTNSTFKASWDSSADGTKEGETAINSGYGINQWGSSGDYKGADLMQLLNGYYIEKNDSNIAEANKKECKYNNASGQSGFAQTCTTESLTTAKMKPLTSVALSMATSAVWDTYAVSSSLYPITNSNASTAYLQEKGISAQYVGSSGCTTVGGNYCNDGIERTTSWTGLVGLLSVSDTGYANGWLYNSVREAWSILPSSSGNAGRVWSTSSYTNAYNAEGVCPSVYLHKDVKIIGGNGDTEPYKLSM